ncbi:MAG: lipoyl(octanoyl) transferase LipB [Hyphomicrobiaceae bacterium]
MNAPSQHPDLSPVAWSVSTAPVAYGDAVAFMEARVADIAAGRAPELVWLLEHPPLYTAGTSARPQDLLDPGSLPVHHTGRGGQYTYHGPGQRIAYVMLDVRRRGGDVRRFVTDLEGWIIDALSDLGVTGECIPDRVGVWVRRPQADQPTHDKIAAIGIRLRRWISYHGIAINVAPDLGRFAGIVPCGISDAGVTSLAQLGRPAGYAEVDAALIRAFARRFGTGTTPPAADGARELTGT